MKNRPTRRVKRPTRISDDEPSKRPARRRERPTGPGRRVAKPAEDPAPVRRKRVAKKKRSLDEPKAPDVERRRKARAAPPSTRTIILAMSPNAANILRAMLGRARHDEPELEAIRQELEDQLS